MRTIPTALSAHLQQGTTSIATLLKLTRRDGVTLGFTDHDADISYGGVTYRSAIGYLASAIEQRAGAQVDNVELQAMIDSDLLEDDDLQFGRWDHAEVVLMLCNWADPSMGIAILLRGWIGEVSTQGAQYRAEVRSLSQALSQEYGRQYGPECDAAKLGDERCRLDLAPHTVSSAVTEVGTDTRINFSCAGGLTANDFLYGWVEWTSGDNVGVLSPIKYNSETAFTLLIPSPKAIVIGDTFNAVRGCDRRFETCRDKFANTLNFQGFPQVPGVDQIVQYPS